jgi:hypothetical protein
MKPKQTFNFELKFTPDYPSLAAQCDKFYLKYDLNRMKHFEVIRTELFHLHLCGMISTEVVQAAIPRLFEQIVKHVFHSNNLKLQQDKNAPKDAPEINVLPDESDGEAEKRDAEIKYLPLTEKQ